MIPREKITQQISRRTWDRKATKILQSFAHTVKNDYTFADDKEIVIECDNIEINGINIKGDCFSAKPRYINVGFLKEETKTVITNDDKEEKTEYTIYNIEKTAEIEGHDAIKTLYFTQEIGTTNEYIGIYIYIIDDYDTIKEKIKEIR